MIQYLIFLNKKKKTISIKSHKIKIIVDFIFPLKTTFIFLSDTQLLDTITKN